MCAIGHDTRENYVLEFNFNFSDKIRAEKFLVACKSLVSVIVRLFRGMFLIATFLLDMVPASRYY